MPDYAKRLKEVERRIANTLEAIEDGGLRGNRTLAERLRKLEDERDQLAAEQKRPTTNVIAFLPRLQERYKALLKSLPAVAARDPARARALLQTLTGGLRMVPTKQGLVAEGVLTGERLAAFAGAHCTGGAGGGT